MNSNGQESRSGFLFFTFWLLNDEYVLNNFVKVY